MEENRIDVYEDTQDMVPETEDVEYIPEEIECEDSGNFGSSLIAGAIGGALVIGGIKLFGKIKEKRAERKALKDIQKTVAEAKEEADEDQ